jgi:hypothetical protein
VVLKLNCILLQGMPDERTSVAAKGIGTTDVDGFVTKLHKAIRDTMEAEAMASSGAFQQKHSLEAEARDWEVRKGNILSALGLSLPKGNAARPGATGTTQPAGAFANTAQLVDFVNFPFTPSTTGTLQSPSATTDLQLGRGVGDDARIELDGYASQLAQIVSVLASASQDSPASQAEGLMLIQALDAAGKGEDTREGIPRSQFWSALFEIVREGSAPGVGFRFFAKQYGADAADALTSSATVSETDLSEALAASENLSVPYTSAMDDGMQQQWLAGSFVFLSLLKRQTLENEVMAARENAARAGWVGDATTGRLPFFLESDKSIPIALVRAHVALDVQQHRAGIGSTSTEPAWVSAEVHAGEAVDGVPLYPQLLLLLKIGAWHEAIQLVEECLEGNRTSRSDTETLKHIRRALEVYQDFFVALDQDTGRGHETGRGAHHLGVATTNTVQHFCTTRLPAEMSKAGTREAIKHCGAIYHSMQTKGTIDEDPWKSTVFCLLAGNMGDPDHADSINSGDLDSYIWHRLWFAITEPLRKALIKSVPQPPLRYEPPDKRPPSVYTLQDVALSLLTYGAQHFDPDGKFAYQYAQSLLLVGQPEAAIAHLATFGRNAAPQRYLHDAAHLALACNYYGVLRTNPAMDASSKPKEVRSDPIPHAENLLVLASVKRSRTFGLVCLDFEYLLKMYASSVLSHSPPAVADYFACVPNRSQRIRLLAAATASTSAFTLYAGPISCSADILRSAIESGQLSRHGQPTAVTPTQEVIDIILQAARLCSEQGRSLDALQLYLRVPTPGMEC